MIILSYQDIKDFEVAVIPFVLTIILLLIRGNHIISGIFSIITLNIIHLYKKNSIAFADIIIFSACSYNIHIEEIGLFYLLTSMIALAYGYIKQSNKIPLIPCICLSFFFLNFKTYHIITLPL